MLRPRGCQVPSRPSGKTLPPRHRSWPPSPRHRASIRAVPQRSGHLHSLVEERLTELPRRVQQHSEGEDNAKRDARAPAFIRRGTSHSCRRSGHAANAASRSCLAGLQRIRGYAGSRDPAPRLPGAMHVREAHIGPCEPAKDQSRLPLLEASPPKYLSIDFFPRHMQSRAPTCIKLVRERRWRHHRRARRQPGGRARPRTIIRLGRPPPWLAGC